MRSMTGYGRRQVTLNGREMTVEIKTVNHRFLDIAIRMPRSLGFLEEAIRRRLGGALKRGHADVFVAYRNLREDFREVAVDEALLCAYQKALKKTERLTGAKNDMKLSKYALLPDVLQVTEKEEDQEAVLALLDQVMGEALEDVKLMRVREGNALRADLVFHLGALEELVKSIAGKAPDVPRTYKERLEARLQELNVQPAEPQRLAQEVALFADKCAIDEELFRLNSHISQARSLLEQEGETGRKLDFLIQEMNREINTVGSKASDAQITNWVVEAKSEIEKLREQIQNVE